MTGTPESQTLNAASPVELLEVLRSLPYATSIEIMVPPLELQHALVAKTAILADAENFPIEDYRFLYPALSEEVMAIPSIKVLVEHLTEEQTQGSWPVVAH